MFSYKNRIFTLIELLVVIGVIAILAGMLLPALGKARQKALGIACTSQLKQLSIATQGYADDYDGCLPVSGPGNSCHWNVQLRKYVSAKAPQDTERKKTIYTCPQAIKLYPVSDTSTYQNTYGANGNIYFSSTVSATRLSTVVAPSKTMNIGDGHWEGDYFNWYINRYIVPTLVHNKSWNTNFLDGHVKALKVFYVYQFGKNYKWQPEDF